MKNLLIAIIPLITTSVLADNTNQSTHYSKSSRCQLIIDSNANILTSSINGKSQQWQGISFSEKLSRFRSKNYCVTLNGNDKSISMYNKNTGEVVRFYNFNSVIESPDGSLLSIAESSENDGSFIEKISFLSKDGKYFVGASFDEKIPTSHFSMKFSPDSKFLNFYGAKENGISYNALNVKNGKLHTNLASKELTYGRWNDVQIKDDEILTKLYPVNDKEYVTQTDSGDVLYVVNNDISWRSTYKAGSGEPFILGVGSVYVALFQPEEGIVLHRRTNGEKFKVISPKDVGVASGYTIINSDFMSSNKFVILTKRHSDGVLIRFVLNLNSKKIKAMKEFSTCGFDVDC